MVRVVIGNDGTLAGYPQGGGHWSMFLQYLLGLRALGHDALLFEITRLPRDGSVGERELADAFFARLDHYGLTDAAALLVYDAAAPAVHTLEAAHIHGPRSAAELRSYVAGADVLWNLAGALKPPLLDLFPHRVFLDVDPAVVHLSALEWDMGLSRHQRFLTVGTNIGGSDCEVPTLGLDWRPFRPFVHLPMWERAAAAPQAASFTTVTHWNWDWLTYDGRDISMSKRDAYLRCADLPQRTGVACEIAITAEGDAEGTARMRDGGWRVIDAWSVADSPPAYRSYIAGSRGEICCPKPIHAELRSGWLSDRSVCYLATGRPVLMEDTGLGPDLPDGQGLVLFRTPDDAVEGLTAVVRDYARHSDAARALAVEFFSAAEVLPRMLESSA